MPSIHVLTHRCTLPDALGTCEALRDEGHEAQLYVDGAAPPQSPAWRPLEAYAAGCGASPTDLLIYHHSDGWQRGLDLVSRSPCRRVVKQHGSDGAALVEHLTADLWLTDLTWQTRDLVQQGVDPGHVHAVPPAPDAAYLDAVEADLDVLRLWSDTCRHVLAVVDPRDLAGQRDLLAAFSYYRRYLNPRCRLFLLSTQAEGPPPEAWPARHMVQRARLGEAVVLTVAATAAALKAHYLIAHALLWTGRHRLFCHDLVRAMHYRVPCVAAGALTPAALLGGEALAWDQAEPPVLAEGLHACLDDPTLARRLAWQQRQRYEALFAPAVVRRRLLAVLRPLLQEIAA